MLRVDVCVAVGVSVGVCVRDSSSVVVIEYVPTWE